jgi:hypothetical protein
MESSPRGDGHADDERLERRDTQGSSTLPGGQSADKRPDQVVNPPRPSRSRDARDSRPDRRCCFARNVRKRRKLHPVLLRFVHFDHLVERRPS